MSKKAKHEDHLNHEAWAIPYADLMTLLLAFFVVMYAVSAVNEGKYRVMSQSMTEAFNGSSHVIAPMGKTHVSPHNIDPAVAAPAGQAGAALMPILVPIPARPAPMRVVDARKEGSKAPPQSGAPRSVGEPQDGKGQSAVLVPGAVPAITAADHQQEKNLGRIQEQVQGALQPLIDKKLVIVRRTANWLEIEIRTDILFPSGVAQLTRPADTVLNSLASILAPFSNPVRVEGYTDDLPINTAVYPSNWELSAARAASVARLFSDQGVSPNRIGIIGWGQFRPAADNRTVEGRNRNRRVLVVVLSDHATPTRYSSDSERVGELADAPGGTNAQPSASVPTTIGSSVDDHTTSATATPAATAPVTATLATSAQAGAPDSKGTLPIVSPLRSGSAGAPTAPRRTPARSPIAASAAWMPAAGGTP